MNNAYTAYKTQSIMTLTPGEVVVRLYLETEKQLNLAIIGIKKKDYAATNKALVKAQDVVNALRSVLDMKIPMSKDLDAIYEYFNKQILTANMHKDIAILKELIPMVEELRGAFQQITMMPKEQIG